MMACTETVPRVREFAAAIPEALEELFAATGLGPTTPVGLASSATADRRAPAVSSSARSAAGRVAASAKRKR
jgi:hypothetical protein